MSCVRWDLPVPILLAPALEPQQLRRVRLPTPILHLPGIACSHTCITCPHNTNAWTGEKIGDAPFSIIGSKNTLGGVVTVPFLHNQDGDDPPSFYQLRADSQKTDGHTGQVSTLTAFSNPFPVRSLGDKFQRDYSAALRDLLLLGKHALGQHTRRQLAGASQQWALKSSARQFPGISRIVFHRLSEKIATSNVVQSVSRACPNKFIPSPTKFISSPIKFISSSTKVSILTLTKP